MQQVVHDEEQSAGRSSAKLGVISLLLLGGSLIWAHHWGPLTDSIVVAWALSTVLALLFGVRPFRRHAADVALAWVGLACVLASVFLVAVTGTANALGMDPLGSLCGGG